MLQENWVSNLPVQQEWQARTSCRYNCEVLSVVETLCQYWHALFHTLSEFLKASLSDKSVDDCKAVKSLTLVISLFSSKSRFGGKNWESYMEEFTSWEWLRALLEVYKTQGVGCSGRACFQECFRWLIVLSLMSFYLHFIHFGDPKRNISLLELFCKPVMLPTF